MAQQTKGITYEKALVGDDTKIILNKGGCFGDCPIYTVTIYSDGKIVYEGMEYVKVKGHHEKRIPVDQVKQLLNKFNEMDFLSMIAKAKPVASNCKKSIADLPLTKVSLIQNGKSFTLDDQLSVCYEESFGKPLGILADAIDNTAEIKDWIM